MVREKVITNIETKAKSQKDLHAFMTIFYKKKYSLEAFTSLSI